jgi:hypothetical protein
MPDLSRARVGAGTQQGPSRQAREVKSRVVVDTNVVVAGLLTSDPASPVARVLEGMLSAAFVFAVSGRF